MLAVAVTSTLTIRDETLSAEPVGEPTTLTLDALDGRTTAREILRARVYQEADEHNRRVRQANAEAQPYRGLVTPTAAERSLNGPRVGLALAREVDWRKQFDAAREAFARGGFLILVDDKQVADLDEPLTLRAGGEVTFVRLTMLVGG